MKKQKKVAAIHDLSGFGKCSLTVALPILSAAGIETSVLPTAILSTHTGGFTGYTFRDLTEDIPAFAHHWKSLDLQFDGIYTGYLGSFKQLEIIKQFFTDFKRTDNIILTDPVMADNGALYPLFDMHFVEGMSKVCEKADIITPNITEACLLAGEPYREGPYAPEFIINLFEKLTRIIGDKKIVLTGVFFNDKELGAAVYTGAGQPVEYAMQKKIDGVYHGTGDVFASALLAGVLNGFSLKRSAEIAVNFSCASIIKTHDAQTDIRFGVNFEQSLPGLMKSLALI